MGQCLSCNQETAQVEENTSAKLVKLASLKLQDAGSKVVASGGETAPELVAAKALIKEATNTLDKFDGKANRISQAGLQAVQLKLSEAKELVVKAGGNHDIEESITHAEEALSSAGIEAKKDEMALIAADAADAAVEGARRLEKTVSSTGANGRSFDKVTSDVAEAQKALGAVAVNEVYGSGADDKQLETATERVNAALQALDQEIKAADGDFAVELEEVKSDMMKAATNLEKRTSFK